MERHIDATKHRDDAAAQKDCEEARAAIYKANETIEAFGTLHAEASTNWVSVEQ